MLRKHIEAAWLRNTKKELHDCVKSVPNLHPHLASMTTSRSVLKEDNLKNCHRNLGTLGCIKAAEERNHMCVSLGLLQNIPKSSEECL